MRVTQPYDGELIAEIPVDSAAEVESKLEIAAQISSDRANWLPAWCRIDILRRLARLAVVPVASGQSGHGLLRGPRIGGGPAGR